MTFKQLNILELPRQGVEWRSPFGWAFRLVDGNRARALHYVFSQLEGRVLDHGCGSKPYEALLRHSRISEWFGVDLPVRTSGERHEAKADAFITNDRIPCPDQSFEIVLSSEVLEHVEDLELVMQELARVTKTNGHLVITVPMTSILHEEPFDYRRFTPYGMEKLGARHGLRLESSIALQGPIGTIATLIACHLNFIRKIPILGPLIKNVLIETTTRVGATLERMSTFIGLNQHSISYDLLFVLRKD